MKKKKINTPIVTECLGISLKLILDYFSSAPVEKNRTDIFILMQCIFGQTEIF